jgi:hypothetical protein
MTDNFFKQCPPMNSDARQLGDYKTATQRNEYIKYVNDIWRDDQYRLFLQVNGETIINREMEYHLKNNECFVNECIHTFPTNSTPSEYAAEMNKYNTRPQLSGHVTGVFDKSLVANAGKGCSKYTRFGLNPK